MLRVAVEGCGHGKLHDIYTSVQESCHFRGWDTVDLLIIGGDFQAVRNQWDLGVTAMPAKYRQMADFHEYYSGRKTAPYLTIFIGGNHEASNHLFELYYGGWVAPNIYYLGAANVLKIGSLRIAGLSGIWKGYDYRKRHFERLPYNQEEIYSIYHVRDLDVRKLLALRSQVDIGLSHDWPQGVEWYGNFEELFRRKRGFEEDAKSGKLGNKAARQCFNRLRPAYWFSAHLHTRFSAVIYQQDHPDVTTYTQQQKVINLAAWQNFPSAVQKADTQERAQMIQNQESKREEDGIDTRDRPPYSLDETFKKVTVDNDFNRLVMSSSKDGDEPVFSYSNDGGLSRPIKRLKQDSSHFETGYKNGESDSIRQAVHPDGITIASANETTGPSTSTHNPDAIDIEMSDSGEESSQKADQSTSNLTQEKPTYPEMKSSHIAAGPQQTRSRSISEASEDGGLRLNDAMSEVDTGQDRSLNSTNLETNQSLPPQSTNTTEVEMEAAEAMKRVESAAQWVRSKGPKRDHPTQELPFPDEIFNKKTRFLALSKAEPNHDFLQLLEIESLTDTEVAVERPLKIQYDPEWLAILRVFAPELSLGGSASQFAPPPQGEKHYRDRIIEESKWIDEHVVKPGLLQVPENFSITAQVYNPNAQISPHESPREVTNPQTVAFCKLIGIDNHFDISEKERDLRMAHGPRPTSDGFEENMNRKRQNKRGGWRGQNRGDRGGFGFGRARGRGRF